MSNFIYENEHYTVVKHSDVLGEDGKYGRAGYAVINKQTEVVEHTTMVLPQALFQADAFAGALGQIKDTTETESDIGEIGETSPIIN